MEHQDRRQREGEKRDLAPDRTDPGSRPQAHEIGVPPEPPQPRDGLQAITASTPTLSGNATLRSELFKGAVRSAWLLARATAGALADLQLAGLHAEIDLDDT